MWLSREQCIKLFRTGDKGRKVMKAIFDWHKRVHNGK